MCYFLCKDDMTNFGFEFSTRNLFSLLKNRLSFLEDNENYTPPFALEKSLPAEGKVSRPLEGT